MKDQQLLRDSLISEQTPSFAKRCLHKIDMFSFLPIPKDVPVSTKQSLTGSLIFLFLILGYILFDFITFVTYNPPLKQSHETLLDNGIYTLPRFAFSFIQGEDLNKAYLRNESFTFSISQEVKNQGEQKIPTPINYTVINQDNTKQLPWLSAQTKSIYKFLRTPVKQTHVKGLLFTTANATSTKISINLCDLNTHPQLCENISFIKSLCAQGRIFLFVENLPDTSSISERNGIEFDYFIYNFFLIPNLYKRISISFQVVKTVIMPDYFWRWTQETSCKLVASTKEEQVSDVTLNANGSQSLLLMGITFQLEPRILNERVSFSTLPQHISLWGAFWGVLFALFACIFLSFNRQKFYQKNPKWDRFQKVVNQSNINYEAQRKPIHYKKQQTQEISKQIVQQNID